MQQQQLGQLVTHSHGSKIKKYEIVWDQLWMRLAKGLGL